MALNLIHVHSHNNSTYAKANPTDVDYHVKSCYKKGTEADKT